MELRLHQRQYRGRRLSLTDVNDELKVHFCYTEEILKKKGYLLNDIG
jgi:hypothetical protein